MHMVYTDHVHPVNMIDVDINDVVTPMPGNSMGERLKKARVEAGFASARQAAQRLGVKTSTYSAHENGQNGFDPEAAQLYGRAFGVAPEWLLGVSEHPEGRKKIPLVGSFDPDAPHEDGAAEIAGGVADGFSVGVPRGEIPHISPTLGLGLTAEGPSINIPVGRGTVAAAQLLDTWRLPPRVVSRYFRGTLGNLHILECEGDSMYPRIHDGDFVALDTSKRIPSPEGIFGLYDGYGITLKRVEIIPNTDPPRVMLIPENPRHTSYERSLDEVQIIGRFAFRLTAH